MHSVHPAIANIGYTVLIAALVLFALYRRFRRTFGRQKLREKRMIFRSVALAIVCLLLLISPFHTAKGLAAAASGVVIGIALAFYASAHTKFETTPEGRFYRPNGYIGMAVSALFIGRIIYRFIVVYPMLHSSLQQATQNQQPQMNPLASYQHSPLTLGIYFLLAGYYICYYVSVIVKSRETHAGSGDNGRPKLIT